MLKEERRIIMSLSLGIIWGAGEIPHWRHPGSSGKCKWNMEEK